MRKRRPVRRSKPRTAFGEDAWKRYRQRTAHIRREAKKEVRRHALLQAKRAPIIARAIAEDFEANRAFYAGMASRGH